MILYYCENCEDKRAYKEVFTHVNPKEGPPAEYTFALCETCNYPSLFLREDMGTEGGFMDDDYYKVYPSNERHIGYPLPELIRSSYEDAIKCELAKISTACVVMVGRTLEAVCKEHVPGNSTIFKGLEEMKKKGIISDEIFAWAQKLRVLRNAGAHATAVNISQTDASEAIDFLQAILEILYHLRPKFQSIVDREGSKLNSRD
jgi:hypothetical protein